MKKISLRLLAMILLSYSSSSSAQSFNQQYYRDGMYFFDGMAKITQSSLFTTHKSEFGLGSDDEMVLQHEQIVQSGKFRASYRQYHKGILVETGLMNVGGEQGIAYMANGFVLTGLAVDTTYTVPEDSALQTALTFFGGIDYPWLDSTCIAKYKEELDDTSAILLPPKGKQVIVKMRADSLADTVTNYRWCWEFNIPRMDTLNAMDIWVDAVTNVVYTSQSAGAHWSSRIGTGWTPFDGSYSNIETAKPDVGFNFQLWDMTRNIMTLSEIHTPSGGFRGYDVIKDNNNDWVESGTKTAASAHWAIERAFDYFHIMHGHAGMNAKWGPMSVYTNCYTVEANNMTSGYDAGRKCDYVALPKFGQSMAILDALGHEYTHGVIRNTSNFGRNEYDYDAASLNEAFCDIFGHRVESFTRGWSDWKIGENNGSFVRSLEDPYSDYGYPINPGGKSADFYNHPTLWFSTYGGGKYVNGGVMRKWNKILSVGGTIWHPVTFIPTNYPSGLGIDKASSIAYVGMRWWFWHNLNYPQAAQQLVNHVITDYGRCTKEHKMTARVLRTLGFTNIATFLCADDVIILGNKTINTNTNPPVQLFRVKQTNDNNDDSGQPLTGTYVWTIPSGWIATANGDELTVTGFTDYNSKQLIVSFTSDNQAIVNATDTLIVHFSNDPIIPNDTFSNNQFRVAEEDKIVTSSEMNNQFSIYPNPANEELKISLLNIEKPASVFLNNMLGQTVLKSQISNFENSIDLRNIPSGVYFLQLEQGTKSKVQKLIIKH